MSDAVGEDFVEMVGAIDAGARGVVLVVEHCVEPFYG